jgi:hypothetical protein
MKKEEFLKIYYDNNELISKKTSQYFYNIIHNIFNINNLREYVESKGYTTKRCTVNMEAYDEIYFGDKNIGYIKCSIFPEIYLNKGCRRHGKGLSEKAIAPIVGVHRVLEWHDIKQKLHCLAGGQTVLYFNEVEISDEEIDDFVTVCKLGDIIEKTKDIDIRNLLNNN